MTWNEGYVTSVPYTQNIYNHLIPSNLEMCLLYNGLSGPDSRKPFTYCELACGYGLTAIAIAALYPYAEVYAMDFNPEHIAYAKKIADSMKLKNIHFSDDSFAQYQNNSNLPEFDFIGLHGIYSWISPENRTHIRNFIQKKLKIGGVVTLSYNTLPGWSDFISIQHLFNYLNKQHGNINVFTSLKQCWSFMEQLKDKGFYHIVSAYKSGRLDFLKKQNPHYQVHELFNLDWHPMFIDQVIKEMQEIKLNYSGASYILDNIIPFCLPQNIAEFIASLDDETTKQLLKDIYLNTSFRRDIYQKGRTILSLKEQKKIILSFNIIPIVNKDEVLYQHKYNGMEIDFKRVSAYEQFINLVYEGTNKIEIIWDKLGKIDFRLLRDVLFIFWGLKYIYVEYPESSGQKSNVNSIKNFNSFMLKQTLTEHQSTCYLLSPKTKESVPISLLESQFINCLIEKKNEPLENTIINNLNSENLVLFDDKGNELKEEESAKMFIKEKYQNFQNGKLNHLKKLDIL